MQRLYMSSLCSLNLNINSIGTCLFDSNCKYDNPIQRALETRPEHLPCSDLQFVVLQVGRQPKI